MELAPNYTIGADPVLSGGDLTFSTPQHLSFLSHLLTLRLSSDLQVWGYQRNGDVGLARLAL